MWAIGKEERLECPPEFQQRLTDIFGVNVFGGPIYRLIWGQSNTFRVSNPYGGYEDQLEGSGQPAWLIQRWTPPEKWGTPEVFEIVNQDPCNAQPLFEYPEFGRYETIFVLNAKELRNGILRVEHFPLDYSIIDEIVPFLDQTLQISVCEQQAIADRAKTKKAQGETDQITDRLMDALPTRYGPTSYSRQGCRTSLLDKKMAEIQQVWNQQAKKRLRPVGMSQSLKPW